jgi:ribosomal silencing factor RsfS
MVPVPKTSAMSRSRKFEQFSADNEDELDWVLLDPGQVACVVSREKSRLKQS